jgi:hypothetical protein
LNLEIKFIFLLEFKIICLERSNGLHDTESSFHIVDLWRLKLYMYSPRFCLLSKHLSSAQNLYYHQSHKFLQSPSFYLRSYIIQKFLFYSVFSSMSYILFKVQNFYQGFAFFLRSYIFYKNLPYPYGPGLSTRS